jgi:sulfate transport system ATP-binding protein
MLRVGFEVRLTVRPAGHQGNSRPAAVAEHDVPAPGEEADVTVVLTRSHARELGVDVGSQVWLSPNRGSTTVPPTRVAVQAV